MKYNRKEFIRLTGSVSAGLALGTFGSSSLFSSFDSDNKKIKKFGLQLYTLRDVIPADPKGVLTQVASYGYKQVESYEHDKLGMFWGMSHTDFKKFMDDLGMTIISSHCDINKNFEQKAAQAAEIGMKYLMCPYKGPQKSIDDFKRFADEFNQKGEICKKAGIRFAYHNHDYSFKLVDGQMPQEVMMNGTDASLVDFEMDIYWVVAAGQDPEAWFKKYKNRFRACHVKDRSKTPGPDNGKNSVVVGTGSIDFGKILKTAKKNGMEYYIVEQEFYEGTTSMKAAEADAAYMKMLSI